MIIYIFILIIEQKIRIEQLIYIKLKNESQYVIINLLGLFYKKTYKNNINFQ